MLWRLRAKESSLHRHVILFGTLLKGQRMDQLMSHLLSSIASVWFMSQNNRGPSILERPMDEPIQSQRSFRGHILVPTLRAYLVMPEAPPAAPEWWELESFPKIKRNQEFSMQTNIDSLATILQTALLLTVQALPGEIGLHHKLSQWSRLWAAVSARCCFPNLLLPSWNLSPSESKKHVVIGMFMFFHCLQCRCFWVLVKKHLFKQAPFHVQKRALKAWELVQGFLCQGKKSSRFRSLHSPLSGSLVTIPRLCYGVMVSWCFSGLIRLNSPLFQDVLYGTFSILLQRPCVNHEKAFLLG